MGSCLEDGSLGSDCSAMSVPEDAEAGLCGWYACVAAAMVFGSGMFQSKCNASSNIQRSCVISVLMFSLYCLYCWRCLRTHASSGGFELGYNSSVPELP